METFLRDYQMKAVEKGFTGCIFNGGVGSGKSRTGLFYYFKTCGGWIENTPEGREYTPMKNPLDLYIITTAKKRDEKEWEGELAHFLLSTDPAKNGKNKNVKIVIDSWNNIKKYRDISNAFFLFDEDKVTGNGAWVKAFLRIAKHNEWVILSATAGDTWEDYIPVFLANGFYRNKTEFTTEHCVYSRFTKYPKIERYLGTGRLIRLRNKILIEMDDKRTTVEHHIDMPCNYDISMYKDTCKSMWDPFNNKPIEQAAGLCYTLRRIVNSSEERAMCLLDILTNHPKAIIFYSFDYELDLIKHLLCNEDDGIYDPYQMEIEVAEWNGHRHDHIPDGERWVYLVQYTAGCEGWNCIKTNTIIFFSQQYSYKVLTQACGRINRINTPYHDLYYYHLTSRSGIDIAIQRALKEKKNFNEARWVNGG